MSSTSNKRVALAFFASLFVAGGLLAQAVGGPVSNWTVPPYRNAGGGLSTMTDISNGVAFVAMVPCRVFDTRNPNGAYGGPRLVAHVVRAFDIDNGPCGPLPANGVEAFSMNFGAILPDGQNGFIKIWPTGEAEPGSSAINPIQGTVVANAAIVPAGTGGSINVLPNTGVHLYGDINGYFVRDYNANVFFEVRGTLPNGGVIFGENRGTSIGASGVRGRATGATGPTYGVQGESWSNDENAAGVAGRDINGVVVGSFVHAGVRGDSTNGGTGVMGLVSSLDGEGVTGWMVNTSGIILTGSHLGYTATTGLQTFGDTGATGSKFFVEPHPTDASKVIQYVSLEGNEAGTYFRGRGRFQNGLAVISPPEDFRMVTDPDGLSIQVTPIGQMATVAVEAIGLDRIVVRGSRNVEFFFTVNGIRHAFKDIRPIGENEKVFVPRSPDERMPESYPAAIRARLISNGTYRADGTVNLETAHRLGWTRIWEEKARRPQPVVSPAP